MARIDLDAVRAETAGDAHEVSFGGEEFTVPQIEDWPVVAVDLVQDGRMAAALAEVLGDQWERFVAHRPTVRQMNALAGQISAGQGLGDAGNSPGSSASSRSTGPPSSPTSSATTGSTPATSTAPVPPTVG